MTAPADGVGRRHATLRLGLTERCNVYWMLAEGAPLTPTRAMLTTAEVERVAWALGVDRVRLSATGH